MIEINQYQNILKQGLLLDHYSILCSIRDGKGIPEVKRVKGFLLLLHKKGYLENNLLTDKALDLIGSSSSTIEYTTTPPKTTDFGKWVLALHEKCSNKLLELTGKKQVRDKINGKSYPFLPNSTDLGKVISKAITQYKLKDLEKIEKCIFNYIDKCNQARQWFPILNYYIMKDNSSRLVTDLESVDEENSTNNPSIHIV